MGVVTQCSADLALSLGLRDDLELDVGTNLGLNPADARGAGLYRHGQAILSRADRGLPRSGCARREIKSQANPSPGA